MLIDFFYRLKEGGIPVSIKEYLTLVEALDKRVASETVDNFYFLSRASLVKDESHYDRFDKVFADYFNGLESIPADFLDRIPEEWLRKHLELQLSDEEKLGGKVDEEEKAQIEEAIEDVLSWMEENGAEAEKEDFEEKLKELNELVGPIVSKYGAAAGGAPDMEDFDADDL